MNGLDQFDWKNVEAELDIQGAAVLQEVFSASEVSDLLGLLDGTGGMGPAVPLTTTHAGVGLTRDLTQPLPSVLKELGAELYAKLLPTVNRWAELMEAPVGGGVTAKGRQPGGLVHAEMTSLGRDDLILLHPGSQTSGGFALDAMLLLSRPGDDFVGGELAMTEQRPRMQSRPIIVPLKLGDIAIFSSGQRPFKGSKGFYKVTLKSAVSRVREGRRVALNLFLGAAK